MAQPMYNMAEDIPTNADTEGHWKALYAGTAGTVTVNLFGGSGSVVFTMVAGGLLPIRVTKVFNTGTSITNGQLIGLN